MTVVPSYLTSVERDKLQELHGVCWNTDDNFDDDVPEYHDIMEFHRRHGNGHWYLPFHETLRYKRFETELDAYKAAARKDIIMDNALNIMRDEAYAKGLKDGRTQWHPINENAPKSKMLLLTNDKWPVTYDGHRPVKIGYFSDIYDRWEILGASWHPTRWAEIPYPEDVN